VIWQPSPVWGWYEFRAWTPLPVVVSGTWVELPPVVIPAERWDLQLLAVRFVDPGHPEQAMGPRYRVWFRNNSGRDLRQPFDVVLVASLGPELAPESPQAGVRVRSIDARETQAVDIRLPFEALHMGTGPDGQPLAFDTLHVLVDAGRAIPETDETNNGARLATADILPIDPAAFEVEPRTVPSGGEVVVAGEGFGPEPGRVLLHLGDIEMEPEILGWYDLGVRLVIPDLPLAGPTQAELIVVRGDGAAANPVRLAITPAAQPSLR